MLKAGIIGLPNVGKSTLFNALLSRQVANVANYPFCTIEPNIGVIEVPDNRLAKLSKVVGVEKKIPAVVEIVDIAGLVKGAHLGEGLGNQFLAHIREVDAIICVLRNFSDANVSHAGSISPMEDFETLTTELQLADLQIIERQKEPKGVITKAEKLRWQTIQKIKSLLANGQSARDADLTFEQKYSIKSFNLLTLKPVIVVLNIDEERIDEELDQIKDAPTIELCAKLEAQLAELDANEKAEMMLAYGIEQSALEKLIEITYKTLGLITFFTTTGAKEVRAWPIRQGTKAPQAGGIVHSDFEEGFIKAKVAGFEDFVEYGGWQGLKEAGKIRFEGKEYKVKEGNIVEFLVKN